MKRNQFLLAGCLLVFCLFLPLISQAAVSSPPYQIGTQVLEKLQPAGAYLIHVFNSGKWEYVGKLKCDRYLRTHQLDLGSLAPDDATVRIKVTQTGGGAAHIDSAFLGGLPCIHVTGTRDANGTKKLFKNDYDVLDSHNLSIDLLFPNPGQERKLRFTARIEPENISKTPFQFPTDYLFRPIHTKKQFYSYSLGNDNGAAEKDKTPFFQELCRTGSGHPSGFTYVWVHNDDTYLYADMDFTPDNTRDGNKDYAELHFKSPSGLQSFRISELEQTWGRPEFTYTDKTDYQHKVYHFKIPFDALGLEKPVKVKDQIALAFSAYGTASPARREPVIAGGWGHLVFVKADGSLWASGFNSSGQVGDGTTEDSKAIIRIGSDSDWVSVAAGNDHTLALKSNGTLWAWGRNNAGQLGRWYQRR